VRQTYRSIDGKDAIDPNPTWAGLKSRSAAVYCRTTLCYAFGWKHGRDRAVNRRSFITLLGGAAAAWPLAARAQQPAMPVIGFLDSRAPGEAASIVAAFQKGLNEVGYVNGQNVAVEFSWAEGRFDRHSALAADLVRRQVALILAGSTPAALAAKTESSTIPIVFIGGGDPIQIGLVTSFNRPGGNVTGVNLFTDTLEAKKLELLHQFVPKAGAIGVLINPSWVYAEIQSKNLQAAARTLGLQIDIVNASNEKEIDTALATLAERHITTLLVTSGPFFASRRDQLVTLAARYACPRSTHSVSSSRPEV
jgi:putative tryptophan/tyrosine transport system substrate-binding protein